MADNPLLIVEGKSDAYVFGELLKKHKLIIAKDENGQEKEFYSPIFYKLKTFLIHSTKLFASGLSY